MGAAGMALTIGALNQYLGGAPNLLESTPSCAKGSISGATLRVCWLFSILFLPKPGGFFFESFGESSKNKGRELIFIIQYLVFSSQRAAQNKILKSCKLTIACCAGILFIIYKML